MIGKCIHKFFLLPLLLLLPISSHALNVKVQPEEIFPGDVIFLKITSYEESSPSAVFRDKEIKFYKLRDNEYGTLIPVDINTPPDAYSIDLKSGASIKIQIKPYAFPTKKITLPEEKVTLSPEDSLRVEKEYLLQEEIWKMETDKRWGGTFAYPSNAAVSEKFGVKRIMNEKKNSVHLGIDMKGEAGAPVRAINSGKVVLCEELFYGGNTLIIDHGMGLFSVYMHLSGFNIRNNAEVEKGEVIGFVGMTGRATGPHLHMSVKLNGVSINPETLMRLKF